MCTFGWWALYTLIDPYNLLPKWLMTSGDAVHQQVADRVQRFSIALSSLHPSLMSLARHTLRCTLYPR